MNIEMFLEKQFVARLPCSVVGCKDNKTEYKTASKLLVTEHGQTMFPQDSASETVFSVISGLKTKVRKGTWQHCLRIYL